MTAEASCRAALYLRLSRDDTGRAGESESIANQRRLLHDYALRQGWPVVAEYADDGVSGTTFDRPQFQKMLCEIPQRGINLILIKDLSRLGRDYLETGRYLERYFPEHGVSVIAVGDAVDTAHEDIFLPMRNYINELYARDTSGKIRAALQTKMKDGRFIGHYAPYGYRRDPQERSRLVPDEAAAVVVRRLFAGGGRGRSSVGACGAAECSGRSTALGLSRQRTARRMDSRNGAAYPAKRGVPRHAHSGKNTKTVLQVGKSPSDSTRGAVYRTPLPRGTRFAGGFRAGAAAEPCAAHFALRRLCQCVYRHRILRGLRTGNEHGRHETEGEPRRSCLRRIQAARTQRLHSARNEL